MDQAFVTSFIRSTVYVALLVLLSLAGFFARQWFRAQGDAQKEREKAQADRDTAMQATMAGLTTAVSELNRTLVTIGTTQARHDEVLKEHGRQLQGIWDGSNCMNPNCLIRQGAKP